MHRRSAHQPLSWALAAPLALLLVPASAPAACCYFSAKGKDIQQPAQKVFLTWDPVQKLESFTVQPKFEGNALDFGMVIPTPSQPKLHEMPRDFFKSLAIFSILKTREVPTSKLLPVWGGMGGPGGFGGFVGGIGGFGGGMLEAFPRPRPPAVKIVETGIVGSLDYKILHAGRADDLYRWLKDHKYHYAGDEATLDFYVQKKWYFTVMKIDAMQMKKNKAGTFSGEVTPTRFQFTSEKLVYPLHITQISVKDKTEALFYVQAPYKVDLQGDLTYQYQWVPMLDAASGCTPGGLPGKSEQWLKAVASHKADLLKRAGELGFTFASGQRPQPNEQGRTPTTLEWAKLLTDRDILMLQGKLSYSEQVPDPDVGFTAADVRNPRKAQAIYNVIQQRLAYLHKLRPYGFLVREAPADEVRHLNLLLGHLRAGLFITKFRKIFTRGEMNDDLVLVAARVGDRQDSSEYEEALPTSPP